MTKSTITRERLLEIIVTGPEASGSEQNELARMALAAMDSEPVAIVEPSDYVTAAQLVGEGPARKAVHELYEGALRIGDKLYRHAQPAKGLELAGWQFKSVNGDWLGLIDEHGKNQVVRDGYEVREVFAMADGVNDRNQVRSEHAEWSQSTFGNVGPIGPLKHLAKEALEAAAAPGDLSEWADMQFLLWDAQRRAGITDEQITQAMIEKLAVNKQREWPEPKDGEPRLHIKEQPAPVPAKPVGFINGAREPVLYGEHIGIAIGAQLYAVPQPAPVVQCPFPCGWDNLNKLAIQDAAFVAIALVEGEPATESIRQAVIANNDRLLKAISACRAAMLSGGKP